MHHAPGVLGLQACVTLGHSLPNGRARKNDIELSEAVMYLSYPVLLFHFEREHKYIVLTVDEKWFEYNVESTATDSLGPSTINQ